MFADTFLFVQLSTGRGGIGNLRPNSTSRDARPATGPDDFSQTRGREPHVRKVEEVGVHIFAIQFSLLIYFSALLHRTGRHW